MFLKKIPGPPAYIYNGRSLVVFEATEFEKLGINTNLSSEEIRITN